MTAWAYANPAVQDAKLCHTKLQWSVGSLENN